MAIGAEHLITANPKFERMPRTADFLPCSAALCARLSLRFIATDGTKVCSGPLLDQLQDGKTDLSLVGRRESWLRRFEGDESIFSKKELRIPHSWSRK